MRAQPFRASDYLGPLSIFDSWNEQSSSGPKAFTLSENGEVKCDYGRAYKTDYKGSEHPAFDSILVPGGRGRKNIENIAWAVNLLKNNEQQCSHILSVCTGAFLLKDARLIDGKDVTTHHFALKELEDYGNATVKKDLSFVSSDRVWSSAGVYCGSKMALAFIKSFEGYQNSEGNTLDGDYQKVLNAVQHDEVF